jgi:hypothetical protein
MPELKGFGRRGFLKGLLATPLVSAFKWEQEKPEKPGWLDEPLEEVTLQQDFSPKSDGLYLDNTKLDCSSWELFQPDTLLELEDGRFSSYFHALRRWGVRAVLKPDKLIEECFASGSQVTLTAIRDGFTGKAIIRSTNTCFPLQPLMTVEFEGIGEIVALAREEK